MAVISGARGVGALLSANVKPDVDNQLKVLEPYQTPVLTWLMFINENSKVCTNKYGKFTWFEDAFFPHQTTVTSISGGSASEDAITVGDSTIFNTGDLCLIEATGDMVYVDSVAGGNVDITYIDGSTSITAASSGYIKIIGSRNLDYTSTALRTAMTTKEVENYNYLNTFVDFITTSEREEAGEAYTDGVDHDGLLEKRIKELKLEVERWLVMSNSRGAVTSGNEQFTYGYGIDGRITTNVSSYVGILDEDTFDDYLKDTLKLGVNRKLHIAGTEQMNEIHKFMKERYTLQQTPGQKAVWNEYGIDAPTYRVFNGTVTLLWNPVMDGKFENYGYTIDEESVMLRFAGASRKNGPRKFRVRDIDVGRNTGSETEILFDVGLQMDNESKSAKLYKSVV